MKRFIRIIASSIAALVCSLNASAQTVAESLSQTEILGNALSNSVGSMTINMSAGAGNAQANIVSLSTANAVKNINEIKNRQQVMVTLDTPHRNERTEIGAGAFQNASGIIIVNQSSGTGNAQANLVSIASEGMSEASIAQLSQVNVPYQPVNASAANASRSRVQQATISDSAFNGARGIAQINQSAGSGNRTANVFALSLGAGMQ